MASRPDEAPESIIIGQFTGLKNTVSEERLSPGDLSRAVNIDIDDSGQARRRRGQTLKLAGDWHSLWNAPGGRTFGVRDGELSLINAAYQVYPIATVGPREVGYTEIGDTVFYSSADHSGKVLSDNSRVDWGQREDGTAKWWSPVMRPTDTLGAVRGKMLGAPPQANLLEAWNGRIYMAHERLLWATELFIFDYVDKTKNYLQFESDITVLCAVDEGLYVGTQDGLYYLTGTLGKMPRKQLMSSPVIRGSAVRIPADDTAAGLQRGGTVTDAVMMMTEQGIVTCFSGGTVVNATKSKVVFPGADNAAALHRDDSGVSSYVSVTRSSGGPSTNARIGDYVDAEIRRATGS